MQAVAVHLPCPVGCNPNHLNCLAHRLEHLLGSGAYHHRQQSLDQVNQHANQQESYNPQQKSLQFNVEKPPPEKSTMNHLAKLHAAGHIQTIPIIMIQALLPPTLPLLPLTSLTSQIARSFSKLPSPNSKMTRSPLLKRDPAQTGRNGKQQWTAKSPRLNKLAHGSLFPDPPTRTLSAANGYSISSATQTAPSKNTRPDS